MGNLDVKLEQLLYVFFTMIEVDKFLIKQNRFNGYYRWGWLETTKLRQDVSYYCGPEFIYFFLTHDEHYYGGSSCFWLLRNFLGIVFF